MFFFFFSFTFFCHPKGSLHRSEGKRQKAEAQAEQWQVTAKKGGAKSLLSAVARRWKHWLHRRLSSSFMRWHHNCQQQAQQEKAAQKKVDGLWEGLCGVSKSHGKWRLKALAKSVGRWRGFTLARAAATTAAGLARALGLEEGQAAASARLEATVFELEEAGRLEAAKVEAAMAAIQKVRGRRERERGIVCVLVVVGRGEGFFFLVLIRCKGGGGGSEYYSHKVKSFC
jgi:hypothetical protein